jgi:hypothetical protein
MNKPLYQEDFYAWTVAQADVLRRRSANEIDWENLQEEVESLGRQQESELRSHLIVLLVDLLKWEFQQERRTRGWTHTVAEQRIESARLIRINPSLKPRIEEILEDAYGIARIRAARETKRPKTYYPEQNPFGWQDAMTWPVEWKD